MAMLPEAMPALHKHCSAKWFSPICFAFYYMKFKQAYKETLVEEILGLNPALEVKGDVGEAEEAV